MTAVHAETPLSRIDWRAIADAAQSLRDEAIIATSHPNNRHALHRAYEAVIEDLAAIAALVGYRVEAVCASGSVMLETEAETVARHVALRPVVLEDFGRAAE